MHRLRLIAAALALTAAAAPAGAQNVRFEFCWIGNGGYTMEGIIGFPEALLGTGIITHNDVTEFSIVGFLNDVPVGSWSLDKLTPTTSWELYFDTDRLEFPVGGSTIAQSYQQWNANGAVNDCGVEGFGFNGG
ncbi:MAG: hypothetical protein AAF914_06710, partial [Pseudomonadota bacterium]